DLEPIVLINLLAALDLVQHAIPLIVEAATSRFVDREFRVYEIAMILDEIAHAVECAGRLLATSKRDLDVAQRLVALRAVAQQSIDENGGHRLVVHGAAAIEVAVFFDERERIAVPVLAIGFHDVEVREEQQGLERWLAAAQHRHEVALP